MQKANDTSKEWPVMEVKPGEDPFEDPWERMRDAKRSRMEKNIENRMRNEERAGTISKGTTRRILESMEKVRKQGKEGGNKDRDTDVPSGVAVDLKTRKGSDQVTSLKRGKDNTVKALLATQRSTASLGNFDKIRDGEPERKKAMAGLKKRKFEGATDKKVIASETEKGMKLLDAVINGGGAAREKAKRKGNLAKGETAYDYEFDDGLGASTFRKKKGRAGMGKMKKMTKKRVV
jgi:regulator of ribosome biosynthesis